MASRTATAGPIERPRKSIVGPSSTGSRRRTATSSSPMRASSTEDRDGHLRTLDIEVETLHYRGAHASSKASSGFSRHSAGTARVVGARGSGGGGRRVGLRGLGISVRTNGRSGGRAARSAGR